MSARSLVEAVGCDDVSSIELKTLANFGFLTCQDKSHRVALFGVYQIIMNNFGGSEAALNNAFREKRLNEYVMGKMKGRGELSGHYRVLKDKGGIKSLDVTWLGLFDHLPDVEE